MAKYKGKYIGTVKTNDVGRMFRTVFPIRPSQCLGKVMLCDVGKQVYNDKGIICIENTEQMTSRLLSEHSETC